MKNNKSYLLVTSILILCILIGYLSNAQKAFAASITPTVGSELLTDPDVETWVDESNLTNYTFAKTGTTSLNRDTNPNAGTYAARVDWDAGGDRGYISQSVMTVGNWYQVSAYSKINTGTFTPSATDGVSGAFTFNAFANVSTVGTTYAKRTGTMRAVSNTSIYFWNGSVASKSIYWDTLSVKLITLSSMFGEVVTSNNTYITTSANWTLTAGMQGGFVLSLDSTTTPKYFILVYADKSYVYLDKCINGTYTNLLKVAITYGDAKEIKVLKVNNTYSVYYDGAQKGSDQYIYDAGLGTLFGVFSTSSDNTYASLSIASIPTSTFTITNTSTSTSTSTNTGTPITPTFTFTPTDTLTPTITFTPTITLTFTPSIALDDPIILSNGTPIAMLERRITWGEISVSVVTSLLCAMVGLAMLITGGWNIVTRRGK